MEPGFVATDLAGRITDSAVQAAAKSMAESMWTLQADRPSSLNWGGPRRRRF
jgi:hypothetical protein